MPDKMNMKQGLRLRLIERCEIYGKDEIGLQFVGNCQVSLHDVNA
jgi:hypothetical protein